jgi:uncharacterized protein
MSQPPSPDGGPDHALDPRHIALSRLIGWIVSACVASASLVLAAVVAFRSGASFFALALVWLVANAVLAWHLQRWPAISHRHTSYRLDGEGIDIRRGVFWRRAINVPRSRVQHTDVSQGPLERHYGLGTLIVYTAGTDHARVALSGLAHPDALRIREQLMPIGGSDAV